jgi:hypothetical protein
MSKIIETNNFIDSLLIPRTTATLIQRHFDHTIVICISRPQNRSLTYREKNCRRGRLRPRQDNLEDVKGFRGQGVHNIFCATENL